MSTSVVYVNKEKYDVYIGRRISKYNKSIFCNPFRTADCGSVEKSLILYYEYITHDDQKHIRDRIVPELKGKVLGCWCKRVDGADELCHGDILVYLADGRASPKIRKLLSLPTLPQKEREKDKKITLWTDGSAKLNIDAGYGYCVVDSSDNLIKEGCGRVNENFTAPHAELVAIIEGLRSIENFKGLVEIKSDSKFLVDTFNLWGPKRAKEDWNKKKFAKLLYPTFLWVTNKGWTISHVRAHTGLKWNERADLLASHFRNL